MQLWSLVSGSYIPVAFAARVPERIVEQSGVALDMGVAIAMAARMKATASLAENIARGSGLKLDWG